MWFFDNFLAFFPQLSVSLLFWLFSVSFHRPKNRLFPEKASGRALKKASDRALKKASGRALKKAPGRALKKPTGRALKKPPDCILKSPRIASLKVLMSRPPKPHGVCP